jgi:predicted small secreted protein
MKKTVLLCSLLLAGSVFIYSCNDNDNSTGNGADTPASNNSNDMRNDNTMNSGDQHNENNLENGMKGGDNGTGDVTSTTDSTRTNHPNDQK